MMNCLGPKCAVLSNLRYNNDPFRLAPSDSVTLILRRIRIKEESGASVFQEDLVQKEGKETLRMVEKEAHLLQVSHPILSCYK